MLLLIVWGMGEISTDVTGGTGEKVDFVEKGRTEL
jgi:hypothetical protein